MKILAFADLHNDNESLKKLREKSKSCDVIICAGDLTIFEKSLRNMLKKIASFDKPTYIIHGNHETTPVLKEECKEYNNIHFAHKKIFKKQGYSIFGYGGGGFLQKDKEFERFIKENKKELQEKNILVTHGPPYGTSLDNVEGTFVGNKSFRKMLKHFDLAISGHLHETSGEEEMIKNTFIINPGPSGRIIDF